MTDQRFLIKCDCKQCKCGNRVLEKDERICVECEAGLHTGYRDREDLEADKILYGDGPHRQPEGVHGLIEDKIWRELNGQPKN